MKNNITKIIACVVVVLGMNLTASAQQTVTFVENTTDPALAGLGAGGYVDIFYTPTADELSEYLNHDLIVTASAGGILDPIRGSGGGQSDSTQATVDTWTHTVFEQFVPNSSSYVFTTYDPVGSFPSFVGDPLPATSINWSVFDTNIGDTSVNGPYHLGRVLYDANGAGTIDFLVFDLETVQGGGETFSFNYGNATGGNSPTAIFANAPYSVGTVNDPPGTILPLTLDASPSTGDGPLSFAWDLDGDGDFETPGTNGGADSTLFIPSAFAQFGIGFDFPIGVQVTSSLGSSIATTTVSVIPEPASLLLASMGLIGIVAARRRRVA